MVSGSLMNCVKDPTGELDPVFAREGNHGIRLARRDLPHLLNIDLCLSSPLRNKSHETPNGVSLLSFLGAAASYIASRSRRVGRTIVMIKPS